MQRAILVLTTIAAAACLGPWHEAAAAPQAVGNVDKVQEQVIATQSGRPRPLAPAGDVYFRDKMTTGPGARLEAKLDDGTVLTLGEKGKLTVDEFVYRPGQTGSKLAINVTQGAFLFVGGKIEGPTGGNVSIKTPIGTLGVRGTTVWGGPIDGGFGVLVLKGEVWVKTRHGTVALKEGNGTMIFGRKAPEQAAAWPDDRTKRAVATISFDDKTAAAPVGGPLGPLLTLLNDFPKIRP
jgi:hypothetical protein